ncbi:hypothetical protein NAI59_13030, partial [Francisella tularensis subsp. holarctica]|uniref:hypothetical protein n=1 Tax=Francisella tularensis TaxID=263 RepID=UPI002381C32C
GFSIPKIRVSNCGTSFELSSMPSLDFQVIKRLISAEIVPAFAYSPSLITQMELYLNKLGIVAF